MERKKARGKRGARGKRLEERNVKGKFQSGQMGQTVNLLAYAFGGSNPSLPTLGMPIVGRRRIAEIAQSIEH